MPVPGTPPHRMRVKVHAKQGQGAYRPKSGIWGRFVLVDGDGSPPCWQCKLCKASFAPHATRMAEHYQREHPSADIGPLRKNKSKQLLLGQFTDRKWGAEEQDAAMRAMAVCWVEHGWSISSVESEETQSFLRALRGDFHTPSRYLMRKAIAELFSQTSAQVDRLLSMSDLKFAMIDGWEDPQRLQLFGLSVCSLLIFSLSNSRSFNFRCTLQEEVP